MLTLNLDSNPRLEEIRVFGDPIATILHSTFFPRVSEHIGAYPAQSFRAHVGTDSGQWLQPQKQRQLLVVSYIRQANECLGHYAINLEKAYDASPLKTEVKEILESLNQINLIDRPETLILQERS